MEQISQLFTQLFDLNHTGLSQILVKQSEGVGNMWKGYDLMNTFTMIMLSCWGAGAWTMFFGNDHGYIFWQCVDEFTQDFQWYDTIDEDQTDESIYA